MPYSINRFNGQVLSTVEDGTVDTKYAVKLVGKNYAGYGEIQNENFVSLMENFASTSAPANPITGQLWYNPTEKRLKVYNETTSAWKPLAVAVSGTAEPAASAKGDFLWDETNSQLKVYDGSTYVLVGPQSVSGAGITQMRSRSVSSISPASGHAVIEAIVGSVVVFVIATEEFTISLTDELRPNFVTLKPGINLPYSNTGITDENNTLNKFQGTATNSLLLDGRSYAEVVQAAGTGNFNDTGITIGTGSDLVVKIDVDGTTGLIKNAVSQSIKFQTTSAGTKTPLVLTGNNVLPGADSQSNIGASNLKFNTIYANSFSGVATYADTMLADGTYRYADKGESQAGILGNTIVCRTQAGDIYANYFQGIATSAQYADLAENYLADAEYEPGTVISVGGEQEVTAASKGEKTIGVVSTNPAYLMNSELTGSHVVAVALKGRVPVKVRGEVKKGDELVASGDGYAEALSGPTISKAHFHVFAVALGSNANGESTVEAVIL